MKSVFKGNKDIKYLKEEFSTFLKKKKHFVIGKSEKSHENKNESLVVEEVEL